MPAYRSGVDAARAMRDEAQARVDELTQSLPKDYLKDVPERMVAELETLSREAKAKDETADAYRDAESALSKYERKLGEARDIVAQVRGARRRGERFVHPGRTRRIVLALGLASGVLAVGYGGTSWWNARKVQKQIGAGTRDVAAAWESLKFCLVGNADGDISRTLQEIEAGLPAEASRGPDEWPRRCVRHADAMILGAKAAQRPDLVRTVEWARQALVDGGLRNAETLWAEAHVIEQTGLDEGDAVPPPPRRPLPLASIDFGMPSGEIRTEAFPGDALRIAIGGSVGQQCEVASEGVRCETIAGRKWIDFTMGPPRPEMMALTAFEGVVSLATLPTQGTPSALAESGSLSGVYVAPGGELLALFEAPLEQPPAFLVLQRTPEGARERIPVKKSGSLVWNQIITLDPTISRSLEPTLVAQEVDLANKKLLPEVELGRLPSIEALDERFGQGRSWNWLSSCHTGRGSFLFVGATRAIPVLHEDDGVPTRVAWQEGGQWGPLVSMPESLPRSVLGRVVCSDRTATWTGLTDLATLPADPRPADPPPTVVPPQDPPKELAPGTRFEAWQMRCDAKACRLTRSAPLDDLGGRATVILSAGEEVLLFETELRTSAFSSTPLQTVWMRRAPLEKLATAPRVRVTDSLALGRPIDGLEAFSRADRAYLMLTSNEVRGVVAIEPNREPRSIRRLLR